MDGEGNLEGARRLPGRPIPASFYTRNTLEVAREVIGCLLCRREPDGSWSVGRIVETEAYVGQDDPACHASAGLTSRTRVLFGPSGRAYVYIAYGMHHLVNFVTEVKGYPGAVLVRAVRPEWGVRIMSRRRGRTRLRDLASGPSKLCQAMDIDLRLNGTSLRGPELVVRYDGLEEKSVECGPRVGISVGTEKPWRFWVSENPYVSPGRPGPPGRRLRRKTR